MITINLKRIKDTLPKHGTVELKWQPHENGRIPFIECKIIAPSLCNMYPMTFEQDFEQIKQWQREIIGKENISEFYTETTGSHWLVYLKRQPIEFEM